MLNNFVDVANVLSPIFRNTEYSSQQCTRVLYTRTIISTVYITITALTRTILREIRIYNYTLYTLQVVQQFSYGRLVCTIEHKRAHPLPPPRILYFLTLVPQNILEIYYQCHSHQRRYSIVQVQLFSKYFCEFVIDYCY